MIQPARKTKAKTKARGNHTGKTRPVRFAVIGQGYFAQAAVLPAFARAEGCELRAIFSEDETKLRALKRKYGVTAAFGYERYDEYLGSGEVDAVYVTVPNDQHREYVERAARAGVHVLCEKPLGVDAEDAERMVAVCDSAGVRLMTAYRLHFEAATLEAIERVQSGDIGRPRFFASTFAMQVRKDNIRTRAERGAARFSTSASTASTRPGHSFAPNQRRSSRFPLRGRMMRGSRRSTNRSRRPCAFPASAWRNSPAASAPMITRS